MEKGLYAAAVGPAAVDSVDSARTLMEVYAAGDPVVYPTPGLAVVSSVDAVN